MPATLHMLVPLYVYYRLHMDPNVTANFSNKMQLKFHGKLQWLHKPHNLKHTPVPTTLQQQHQQQQLQHLPVQVHQPLTPSWPGGSVSCLPYHLQRHQTHYWPGVPVLPMCPDILLKESIVAVKEVS